MLWAFVVQVGRKREEGGLWRPVREAVPISRGRHKGLYRVSFTGRSGGQGVARTIRRSDEGKSGCGDGGPVHPF